MIKKRLVKLLGHAKKYIVYQVLFQWLGLLCQILTITASAVLLESAFDGSYRTDRLLQYGVFVVIAIALKYVFDRLSAKMSYLASVDVKRILREKIYGKLLRLGAGYREHAATSGVVQMSVEGVEQLETYFGRYLPQLFYSLLAPLTLFAILSFVNLKASIVLLVCVPLIPVSIVVVQKIAKRLLNKYWGIYTQLGDSFLENLQGLTTLKIYQADEQKAREMDRESQRFRQVTMKVLTMQLNSTSVMDIVAYGGAAVGMVVTILEFQKGNVGLAGTLMILLLASEFFIPLRVLGSFFHIAMNGMAASDRIFAFLDLAEPEEKSGVLTDAPVDIEMRGVHFSYDDSREVLKGVDISLPSGSLVSLVGLSGCGKSTAAGILMGRKKGYQGSVRIQGQELSELSWESIMRHITLVSHNSYLFKGTVRENLLLGCPSAGEEELIHALCEVNLWAFLKEQNGLDTELLERGSNFSGGQCQRLALARALLHDTPVYIFDEATSNIDAESEAMIMAAIHRLAKTKTVLLISHRLANVEHSDKIYMLSDGSVAESGTHAELLAADGAYAELYRKQKELESYAAGEKKTVHAEHVDLEKGSAMAKNAGTGEESNTNSIAARRSGFVIMRKLIGLVRPLLPVMLLAIFLGVAGYLCAISLTILASHGVILSLNGRSVKTLMLCLVIFAVARGFLHYGEQYCNHFIAFKLLAIIRNQVFAALRKLCPAKLEGKDRGNLISILTSDIELLEVFYAHTISPIAIAFFISLLMLLFIGRQSIPAAFLALCGYLAVGVVLPLWNGKRSAEAGMNFRNGFGDLNSFVLDSLRGLDETMQYGQGNSRLEQITKRSVDMGKLQKELNRFEQSQRAVTNLLIQIFSFAVLIFLLQSGAPFSVVLIVTVAVMGSFGPVVALSNLSNNLNQTLASGERVLSLLEEKPQVEETESKETISFTGAAVDHVTFSYGQEQILKDCSMEIPKGKILGIHGVSGSGKSTLLKLLMRFWDVQQGAVMLSGQNIKSIGTGNLRDMES